MEKKYTTQFLFLEINKLCRLQAMLMTTKYFGDKDMHHVTVTCQSKGVKVKRFGESLNLILASIYEQLLQDHGNLFKQ